MLDRPEVVIDLLEPNPKIEEKKEDEELGTTAGLREAARSLSTAALTWYAMAINKLASATLGQFHKKHTVCGVHNIVEIVKCQTTIFLGLSCNTPFHILAFPSWFVSASSWEQVRFHHVSLDQFKGPPNSIPLLSSKNNPTGLPQRNTFFGSNSKISSCNSADCKSKLGRLVGWLLKTSSAMTLPKE